MVHSSYKQVNYACACATTFTGSQICIYCAKNENHVQSFPGM